MRSFVSTGKSVKEAIQLGLDVLNVTMEDVDVEIIQPETKGFMGIGMKKAVVKLSKGGAEAQGSTPSSADPFDLLEKEIDALPDTAYGEAEVSTVTREADTDEISMQQEDLQGKAWVKEGRLYVKDSPNHYPTITIGKGINVYKNDELINENPAIVSENDSVQIEMQTEEQSSNWQVSMDSDKLHVRLEVTPGYRITRWVQAAEPAQHIKLIAEEKKEIFNDLVYGSVMEKLESLGVSHGINQQEIEKALETTTPGTYEIATGKAATPGKDGWIELKVDIDAKKGLKEEDGKIDFREIKTIPTVDQGKVIAIVHPEVAGKPGWTVTNESLPPKRSHPIILKAKKGVAVVDDKIVATESGRPVVEQRGQLVKVSTMPKLFHTGNVNLTSGNISFSGDVEITGEIEENMKVEAGGDVTVHSSISMATLTTSNAITAKRNVVGSELSAGKNNMLIAELGHLLGNMHRQLEEMIAVIKQLMKSPAFKSSDFNIDGLEPLIYILMEKRFKGFREMAKKYADIAKRGKQYLDGDEWEQVEIFVTRIFLTSKNQITSLDRLRALSQRMKELHEWSITPVEPDSYITISSALDSTLYCSGDITIIGQGCINTKVHAGGKLSIMGILRGREVYGRLGIEVQEAGAESGTPTLLSVPSDQSIKIKHAREGTIIRIGNKKYTFREDRDHVVAKLNKDEEIVFDREWRK